MSEKVRAAVFDIAGSLNDAVVLDAYSGSGAVGLEALSRGALLVEAIEADRKTAKIIEQNTLSLGVGAQYQLWIMTVQSWLSTRDSRLSTVYDLVVADPPYAKLSSDELDQLGQLLKPTGYLIISHSSKIPAPGLESVIHHQTKIYGDSALSVYSAVI